MLSAFSRIICFLGPKFCAPLCRAEGRNRSKNLFHVPWERLVVTELTVMEQYTRLDFIGRPKSARDSADTEKLLPHHHCVPFGFPIGKIAYFKFAF